MSQPIDDSDRTFLDPVPEEEAREPRRSENDRENLPRRESSGCRTFAIGCGCLLMVMLLIAIGVGVWVAFHWKELVSDFSKEVATDAINRSSLPPADKARVIKRLNGLADDFKSGKLTPQQAAKIMEQIAQSPLLPLGMLMAVEEHYVKPSGLSVEEKEAAKRTLQRFARGAFEKKIPEADVQEVLNLITEHRNGQQQPKTKLTDVELRAVLEKALEKADAAEISDEPFDVNIADELERAIDRALNPSPAGASTPEPETSEPDQPSASQ